MATTKAPTGLTLTRAGRVFTLKWKIGDVDYKKGQFFSKIIDDAGPDYWESAQKLGPTTTTKSMVLNQYQFYPYKGKPVLLRIGMRVKGYRQPYQYQRTVKDRKGKTRVIKSTETPLVSPWSQAFFDIEVPDKPTLSVSFDEELSNVCTFSWSTPVDLSSHKMLTDTQWQSILVKNSKETDGSKLDWSQATGGVRGASSYTVHTEDTALLFKNGDSYVRWFRVRSRGPRGASPWAYAYRVYALPLQAKVTDVVARETEEGGFLCTVNWVAGSNMQYPIDKTTVQYAITTPESGLSCPAGTSFTDADTSRDTSYSDSATFSIDDQLSVDQCLFTRVNTEHDKKITYGKPMLTSVGFLKDPTSLSVDTEASTFRATITATNASAVEDSFLVVRYLPSEGDPIDIGIIPPGETSTIVQCPDWSQQKAVAFEVYAAVGSYEKQVRPDGVDTYTVVARMRSENTLKRGGTVPVAPEGISVNRVEGMSGTVRVTWDWSWEEANGAQISWSDHPDAWESTDEPETYTISNMHASKWNISGLETGKTWYIRVRLFIEGSNDAVTYGPWSNIEAGTIDLSSAPNKPTLLLSDSVIAEGGSVTASWVYSTIDNTPQAYAEVAVVLMSDEELPPERASEADEIVHDDLTDTDTYIKKVRDYSNVIAHSLTTQHVTIDTTSAGWETGNTYNLACRVKSQSGRLSEWSDVISVAVADPLVCAITESSLVEETETETVIDPETSEEVEVTRTFLSLKEMPLTLTVTGAGEGGSTSVEIQRAASYKLSRPDGDEFIGHAGEIVAVQQNQLGEEELTIDLNNLKGSLDDGAQYTIIATVRDGLGQSAKVSQDFEVHWTHQAAKPTMELELDPVELIAKITPIAPLSADPTDVADIYRLSIDKPELVVQGAQFGTTYVDPYPALGDQGGYRVVLRTQNGDYIDDNNEIAQIDSFDMESFEVLGNEEDLNIIDFNGRQIQFYYNTDYSNTWAKDFQETQYLGGSIQGDWNAAVSRSGTLSSQAITVLDQDMLQAVRLLAVYPGICHVRTADGSSYAADVQVSEDRVHDDQEMLANYSLSITRVDSQGFDGMTLEQYESETGQEEE